MRMLRLDCEKAEKQLGWTPQLGFQETAAWTIDWYREFHKSPQGAAQMTAKQIQAYRKLLNP
jgi:dTDP-D-glucose 4,6-dehydratase